MAESEPVQEPGNSQTAPLVSRRLLAGGGAAAIGAAAVWRLRDDRSTAQNTSGKPILRLLCWEGYGAPVLTERFRADHDCEIEADFLGANDEIFTFLRAGGRGVYDLVTPQSSFVQPLADAGLIAPLDPARLPAVAGLLSPFAPPDGTLFGVPVSWCTAPMLYNPAHLATPPDAWRGIASSRFNGRIVMTEDGIGQLMIWNGALGNPDPARVTIEQLNETTDFLIALKRDRAVAYVGSMTDVVRLLAAGTAWVSTIGADAATLLPAAVDAGLRASHPLPGDFHVRDTLCLAADAPNPDLAQAFIDYLLAPEQQATLGNMLRRGVVNAAAVALLDDPVRALYAYDDLNAVFAVSPLLGFPPLASAGDGIATYVDWVKSWERVRFTAVKSWPWTA